MKFELTYSKYGDHIWIIDENIFFVPKSLIVASDNWSAPKPIYKWFRLGKHKEIGYLHDYLYVVGYPRLKADNILYAAMRWRGYSKVVSLATWLGVRTVIAQYHWLRCNEWSWTNFLKSF